MTLRRLPRLAKDEDGVASTVGTVMALLVVLTFMSLIVNQYVPVWTKDSEAAHMNGALGQLGTFKSDIDGQILSALVAQQTGRAYIPISSFSPITLGTEGVPIFSSPTIGSLRVNQDKGNWTVEFRYTASGTTQRVSQQSQGNIGLTVANRYAIPQDLTYENGAIILHQRDGEAVRVDPQFAATLDATGVSLALNQIRLFGSGSIQGTGTEGIRSKVLGADPQLYRNLVGDVYINGTTDFGPAWYRFYNKTLSATFNYTSDNFKNDPLNFQYFKAATGESVTTPRYIISHASVAAGSTVQLMTLQILNSGVTPIVQFELDQAFVNVAVGRVGATTEV